MPKQLEFIRLHDLADLFGVSKVTIWRMRKRGEIPPPIRISRYVIGWPRPTIEKLLYDDVSRSTVNLENYKVTK